MLEPRPGKQSDLGRPRIWRDVEPACRSLTSAEGRARHRIWFSLWSRFSRPRRRGVVRSILEDVACAVLRKPRLLTADAWAENTSAKKACRVAAAAQVEAGRAKNFHMRRRWRRLVGGGLQKPDGHALRVRRC